jgi:hypothetical protein
MTTDSTDLKLTPTQIQALVVLMAEARDLTNNELKELAGFSLTGADNAKLVKLGLVETDKSHRPYSHGLTDKGWRAARELHLTPPTRASAATKTLLVLLANVQRALERQEVSHAEFFKRGGMVVESTESAVRTAYARLASAPGGWVGLAALRADLADIDRASLDDTLRTMARQEGVRIIPIADTKNLDATERAAALRIGGQDNHAIAIELP